MTEKYTLPSVEEIIELARTEEGSNTLIANFRTKTDNLSIEEALAAKQLLDSEVGVLIDLLSSASRIADYQKDWDLADTIYSVKTQAINTYGYDDYQYGEWINSDY